MRLAISFAGKKSYFLDLRIKCYGCLKFLGEVWVGRACVGANEEELTTCAKFWGQEEGGRENTKKGDSLGNRWSVATDRSTTNGRRPLVAPGRATAGWLAVARRATMARSGRRPAGRCLDNWAWRFFILFLFNLFFKALACSKGLGFLGGLGVQHPIF
jgi:hypothetical protein